MTDANCKLFADHLVDYADGLLPEGEAKIVAAHAVECAACRLQIAELQQSLELAKGIWHERCAACMEGRADYGAVVATPANMSRRRWAAVFCAAAAVAIVLAAGSWLMLGRSPSSRQTAQQTVDVPLAEMTTEEAVAYVERQGRIARLAASAQLLASEPSLKPYYDSARRYLEETYGYRLEEKKGLGIGD